MSRQIDTTKQLTDDEVQYLEDRDWQHVLDANAMHLMGGGADEAAVEESTEVDASPELTDATDGDAEESATDEDKPARRGRKS